MDSATPTMQEGRLFQARKISDGGGGRHELETSTGGLPILVVPRASDDRAAAGVTPKTITALMGLIGEGAGLWGMVSSSFVRAFCVGC